MVLTIYGQHYSPPSEAVMMTCILTKVKVTQYKLVDVLVGEQFKPEFLKMNPFHAIPVMDDDGFTLYESRPIMKYLVDKYADEGTLYPRDLQKRAIIDRILDFDICSFYPPFYDWAMEMYGKKMAGETAEDPEGWKKCVKSLDNLEKCIMGETPYLTGDVITLADISVACGFRALYWQGVKREDLKKWPQVYSWLVRMEEQAFYKEGIETEFK